MAARGAARPGRRGLAVAAPRGPAPASVALSGPQLQDGGAAPDGRGASRPGGVSAVAPSTPRVRRVVVHVAGAVRRPGVLPGARPRASHRCGAARRWLTPDADLTQINLAARLTDGRAIIVPRAGAPAGAASGGTAPRVPRPAGGSPMKLSVNAATAEQLDALDGVGPAMAAAIIELRTKLGGFRSLEQLDDVPGVGEARLASLTSQLDL